MVQFLGLFQDPGIFFDEMPEVGDAIHENVDLIADDVIIHFQHLIFLLFDFSYLIE